MIKTVFSMLVLMTNIAYAGIRTIESPPEQGNSMW